MLNIEIKGKTYPLATTLRVAYEIQGQHNHAPYAEVFKGLAKMTLEDQVGIVYASFKCANPEVAKDMTRGDFLNYCLDNLNLKELMNQLKEIVAGIMGEEVEDTDAPKQMSIDEASGN